MSSGFVSGGTADNPAERDDEWRQAQAELEATRKAKADLAAQHDGKSLFEVLQENKDKKQAEFEERARYKLHVSLNDDEADYLDAIEEKKRKQEAEVRKDTLEQLDVFRRQKEEAERKAMEDETADAPTEEEVQWVAPGRKRKKGPETSLLKGVKLRKQSSAAEENKTTAQPAKQQEKKPQAAKGPSPTVESKDIASGVTPSSAPSQKLTTALSLGLGYASSDDDD
jgi:hypothetical protein